MPTQTQVPGSSQPQIDPTALNLARAIRQVESGDNPNAKGASGEWGIGQWMPGNYEAAAKKYGLDATDKSLTNQQHIIYNQVEEQLKQGKTQSQVASWWNSGKYDPTGNVGVNKEGVKYDTPAYVEKVKQAYLKATQGQSQGQFVTPSAPQQTGGGFVQSPPPMQPTADTPPPPEGINGGTNSAGVPKADMATFQNSQPNPGQASLGNLGSNLAKVPGQALDLGGKLLPIIPDLLKDIQGKNDKTALQQVGDAGMSALWFLPFGNIARGLGVGAKALGLGADAAKTFGNIATGIGSGYGADVSSNLSQGKTGASAATPGLGTLIGGGLPVTGEVLGGLYNKFKGQQTALNKIQGAYEDALGATKTGVRASSKVAARGSDSPAEFLANAGLAPETAEVNGRRIFTTGEDSQTYKTIQQRANALTDLRDQAIEKTVAPSSVEALRQTALEQANTQFIGKERQVAIDHINAEFDAFKGQQGVNEDTLAAVNRIKKYFQGNTNYDATRPSTITETNKLVGSVAKIQVENDATKAGVPGIKALNKIIQQHLDFLNTGGKKGILDKLNGQVIKGGRIGLHVKEGIGGAIGLATSHALGGGLLGDIAGGAGGAYAGNLVSRFLQKLSVGGSMTAATIGRMVQTEPEVVQQFLQHLGREGERIAPTLSPIQTSAGAKVQGLLNRTPGSAFIRGVIQRNK